MSSTGERRATRHTKDCLYAAFNHTVFFNGREGVTRAGWIKPTGTRKQYPAKTLISSDDYGKDPGHHCFVSAPGYAQKSCFPTGEGVWSAEKSFICLTFCALLRDGAEGLPGHLRFSFFCEIRGSFCLED